MKLSDYKELLLNQDLNHLDRELESYKIIREFSRKEREKENTYKIEEGKRVENTINVPGLGEFSFYIYTPIRMGRRPMLEFIYLGRKEYRDLSVSRLLTYHYCPMMRSYDSTLVTWGLSWDRDKFRKAINKKWDKYFEDLEKTLDNICGSPLEEVFLDNHSNKWKQSRATVFKGPKGKAIAWTTISGGYNIQQEHIRMFCKPLTQNHINEFKIKFND